LKEKNEKNLFPNRRRSGKEEKKWQRGEEVTKSRSIKE
jgi:hypothetical protein